MIKEISVPIYNATVLLAVAEPDAAVLKALKGFQGKASELSIPEGMAAVTITFSDGRILVRVRHKGPARLRTKLYVHEAVHVAQRLLEFLGVNIKTADDGEPLAYLVEFLVEEFLKVKAK